jgi:hypothetical protein
MEEIQHMGITVTPRYVKGVVVAIVATARCKYKETVFSLDQEWDIPPERQGYAEEFDAKRMGDEVGFVEQQTGLTYRLFEKVWAYRQQEEQGAADA